jgi:hypothetical protein
MRTQELLGHGSQNPDHGPTLAAFLTASRERPVSGDEFTIVNDGICRMQPNDLPGTGRSAIPPSAADLPESTRC